MYQKLIAFYVNHYYTHKDPFLILCSCVAVKVLSTMYDRFLDDSDIVPLEQIGESKLQTYKALSDRFGSEFSTDESIMKSAYALELITSTF